MSPIARIQLSPTEKVLVASGLLFLASTAYIAGGGDLAVNYLAKGLYISGTMMLIFKK